ncbi:MAG: dTMP kinase [Anaerolineaceae bacterium]|nr:dTMP kinase [Anaerolineaceae bacterium]
MFITFEGPEGSGKTSQIPPLVDFLRAQGVDLFPTREPGGTPISDQVRSILMNMDNQAMHPRTEILLFCASRAQIVEQVIRPKLAHGCTVLCDRYADSTLAYQGYGHGLDKVFLRELLEFTTGGLWPDCTILLDIDVQQGLQRKQQCRGEWNRLDAYELAFHERVRQGYLEMAHQQPERWQIVDASQSQEAVQQTLRSILLNRLASRAR